MENKYQLSIGGRVALSVSSRRLRTGQVCAGRIETTSYIQTKHIMICVGLDIADERRLLDQWMTL